MEAGPRDGSGSGVDLHACRGPLEMKSTNARMLLNELGDEDRRR